jgi:predicted TIM-barrel fold metal-dependent hydrolase
LDATLGEEDDHIKLLGGDLADRFGVFVHIDWQGSGADDDPASWSCNQVSFSRTVVEQLRVAKSKGCLGLKVFKQFGLGYRGPDGELLKIDDSRFDPIWHACGELNFPVLIHTADPAAFFEPINHENERWEELSRHPEWSFADESFPRREELLMAFLRVVERHRKTMFIAAHCANYAEDLEALGKWLEKHPNLYVDLASRIGELGRQPYTARAFLERFDDRILFGTDGPWPAERLGYYWRFLESFDEHFPYSEKQPPPQGLWTIYGVGLPRESLEKIYFRNALTLLPDLSDRYARASEKLKEK